MASPRTTQLRNRLRSHLSENGVRLKKNIRLTQAAPLLQDQIRQTKARTPRQWQLIEGMLLELGHAEAQRKHWRSVIAQEVVAVAPRTPARVRSHTSLK